jgi:hypothetical protein
MQEQTFKQWSAFFETHQSVLLYTVDPGACDLVEGLSQVLQDTGRLAAWYAEGWALQHHPQCLSVDALPGQLNEKRTLLLGSQTNFSRTHHFLRVARQAGARTIFVFDHWKNYAAHFLPDVVPDYIVVADETGREALLEAIGREYVSRVSILPHLGIEAAVTRIQAYTLRLPGVVAVLLDPTESSEQLGYDWRSVLHEIALRAHTMPDIIFHIKPHPRQSIQEVMVFLQQEGVSADRFVLVDMNTEELIAAADEVWGMTTIALVPALRAGKPIKSIQTGRNAKGKAASNHIIEPFVI